MWEELSKYKNNFLQTQIKHTKVQCINEMQNKAMKNFQCKHDKCNTIDTESYDCKSSSYFEDRANLAYGFLALPKLMKQMGNDDPKTRWKALTSLSEYISNYVHCQQAINDEDIVRRVENIFLRLRYKFVEEKYREIEKLLQIFYYIAMHANGGKQILHCGRLINELYLMVKNREKYLEQAANILQLITKDAEDVYYFLDKYSALNKLGKIYGQDVCLPSHPAALWYHLMALIELAPDQAIENDFFEIFYTRIKARLLNYHIYDIRCFALLLRCAEGQKRFSDIDGVKVIYDIFKEQETKPLNTYEYVILTLMNGLMSKKILWRCCSLPHLIEIITNFINQTINAVVQLHCIQILRQLGEMPSIKRYIKANCLAVLKTVESANETNTKQLCELIYWLEREIYHTTDLRLYNKN